MTEQPVPKDWTTEFAWARRYRHNDLFRPGEHTSLNACVGVNGGPYDPIVVFSRAMGFTHGVSSFWFGIGRQLCSDKLRSERTG